MPVLFFSSYISGTVASFLLTVVGAAVSTQANTRAAVAADASVSQAFTVSFLASSTVGLATASVGLGGLSVLLLFFQTDAIENKRALLGFGMGAATLSIYSRIAGGIFSKSVDMGSQLVEKAEATVLDAVRVTNGIGEILHVLGTSSDLFSSFVGSIIAGSVLGMDKGYAGAALVFWISMAGIIASIAGIMVAYTNDAANSAQIFGMLRRATVLAGVVEAGFMAVIIVTLDTDWQLFFCLVIGLVAGIVVSMSAEYFTFSIYPPTTRIALSGVFGPANVIIEGLSVGSYATMLPVRIVCVIHMPYKHPLFMSYTCIHTLYPLLTHRTLFTYIGVGHHFRDY
ncbi:hypothetical protein EON64_06905 [archaeon]|nr:MAG: hypothetical protein EON64_06905 [archaeon]